MTTTFAQQSSRPARRTTRCVEAIDELEAGESSWQEDGDVGEVTRMIQLNGMIAPDNLGLGLD